MSLLSPIDKLDAVLAFMSEKPFVEAANPPMNILKEFNRKMEEDIQFDEFLRIIKKLHKDGHLDKEKGPHEEDTYLINFDGLLFLWKDGFLKRSFRPYNNIRINSRITRAKAIVKIIITILNAIAILYLMWRVIPKD